MATKLKAIDVSYAQGDIVFAQAAADGVKAVIIRSGFGWKIDSQKDQYFDRNIRGFKSAGVPCGAYHYAYATTVEEAKLEAEFCLKCIGNNSFELPIYYDIEQENQASLGKDALTEIALTFCRAIEKAGHNAGVYASLNFFTNYLHYDTIKNSHSIWLAQWHTENQMECDIWQYSSTGQIRGISTNVDMNWCFIEPLAEGTTTGNGGSESGSSGSGNTGSETGFTVGELVHFKGGNHYVSSDASAAAGTPKAGNAKITIISAGAKHPYHIVHTDSSTAVYGWVDANAISKLADSGGGQDIKAGARIALKNVPLYVSSDASQQAAVVTGTYYLWDDEVVHSRVRITNTAANVGRANQVTGWINTSDL